MKNKDAQPEAYSEMKTAFRPSHADFTYEAKYGIRNWQGGGRASARETVGRVAAGAVAKKLLSKLSRSASKSSRTYVKFTKSRPKSIEPPSRLTRWSATPFAVRMKRPRS